MSRWIRIISQTVIRVGIHLKPKFSENTTFLWFMYLGVPMIFLRHNLGQSCLVKLKVNPFTKGTLV